MDRANLAEELLAIGEPVAERLGDLRDALRLGGRVRLVDDLGLAHLEVRQLELEKLDLVEHRDVLLERKLELRAQVLVQIL